MIMSVDSGTVLAGFQVLNTALLLPLARYIIMLERRIVRLETRSEDDHNRRSTDHLGTS